MKWYIRYTVTKLERRWQMYYSSISIKINYRTSSIVVFFNFIFYFWKDAANSSYLTRIIKTTFGNMRLHWQCQVKPQRFSLSSYILLLRDMLKILLLKDMLKILPLKDLKYMYVCVNTHSREYHSKWINKRFNI